MADADAAAAAAAPPPLLRPGREEVEEEEDSTTNGDAKPHSHLPFLEVVCKISGRAMRFAFGTKAGFAIYLINQKSGIRVPPALLIEAVKEGEEPISFGPSAVLVNYGQGWKLQTVVELGGDEAKIVQRKLNQSIKAQQSPGLHPSGDSEEFVIQSGTTFSFLYLGKILAVFAFMFFIGAIFTLLLENLPELISSITSSPL